MNRCKISLLICLVIMAIVISFSFGMAIAQTTETKDDVNVTTLDKVYKARHQVSPSERKAAAKRNAELGLKVPGEKSTASESTATETTSPACEPDKNADQKQNQQQ